MTESSTVGPPTSSVTSLAVKRVASRRRLQLWRSRSSVQIVARGPWRDGRRTEEHVVQVQLDRKGKLDEPAERRLLGRVAAYLARAGNTAGERERLENDLRERLSARGICVSNATRDRLS